MRRERGVVTKMIVAQLYLAIENLHWDSFSLLNNIYMHVVQCTKFKRVLNASALQYRETALSYFRFLGGPDNFGFFFKGPLLCSSAYVWCGKIVVH